LKIQIALVGAVIGFIASGIPGAVIGFLLGMYVDFITKENQQSGNTEPDFFKQQYSSTESPQEFNMALLVLVAAIMNADGTAMKSELDLVKRMLVRTYGEEKAKQMLLILRELIKQRQDVGLVCRQIRNRMAYSQRLELMHILFRISRADDDINAQEMQMLQYIGVQLGITTPDFMSLKAMFISSPDSDFTILDVTSSANEEEVKKAYRKMAMRFHPDRLQGLNEGKKKAAQEKFVKVNKAYENIKKRKGWA
jgi:DnaJ like chaperone protein